MPSGVVEGERLLCFASIDSGVSVTFDSAGWSAVVNPNTNFVSVPDGQNLAVMEKIAGASEPASYVFTTDTAQHVCAAIGVWTGRGTVAGKVGTLSSNTGTLTTPITISAGGLTAEEGDDLIYMGGLDQVASTNGWTFSADSGMTEAIEFNDGPTWNTIFVDYLNNVAAGASGTKTNTATQTTGSGPAGWLAIQLAIARGPFLNNRAENLVISPSAPVSSGNLEINPTTGSKLYVVVIWSGTVTCTLSSTRGLTFTPIGSVNYNATRDISIQHFYASVTGSGPEAVTATFSSNPTTLAAIWVEEFDGIWSAVDKESKQSVNAGIGRDAPTSGTITPAYPSSLAISLGFDQQGPIERTGTGWSGVGTTGWSGEARMQYKLLNSTAPIAATFEDTGSDWHSVTIVNFAQVPSNYAPAIDIQVAGWTPTPDGFIFATIDEDTTPVDTDYVTSPLLRSVAEKCIETLDNPMVAGNYTVNIRVKTTSSTGNLRVRFLDSGGSDVGVTSIQGITTTLTTYALSVTLTDTATQVQIEVTT